MIVVAIAAVAFAYRATAGVRIALVGPDGRRIRHVPGQRVLDVLGHAAAGLDERL